MWGLGLVLGSMLGGNDLIVRVLGLIACKVWGFILGFCLGTISGAESGLEPRHQAGDRYHVSDATDATWSPHFPFSTALIANTVSYQPWQDLQC